ncbi:MAG: hypothetical protein WDN06_19395 [Asticcacaulis sp.]
MTLDGYHIKLNDRIVLSENISGTPQNYGASGALRRDGGALLHQRHRVSTTDGADLVANYRIPTDHYGRFNLALAWNVNNTTIDKLPTLSNSPLTPQPRCSRAFRQYILTNSAPETKGTLGIDWTGGKWSVNGRATYYGDVIDPASAATSDIHTGQKTLVDLSPATASAAARR